MTPSGFFESCLGNDRIHQHDEDAEDGKHHLGKDPDVVNGRNHRPITCIRACVTWVAEGAAAWNPLENCLSAKETDGSIECSQRLGATPMTRAATASGHIETRSRASMSGRFLFTGFGDLAVEDALIHPQQVARAPDHARRRENAVNLPRLECSAENQELADKPVQQAAIQPTTA